MNQQDFIALIQASQSTIKEELLLKHPESKYDLLMLVRSFDLLKNYIQQANQHQAIYQDTLKNALGDDQEIDQSLEQLCAKLRQDICENDLEILRKLNNVDLSISHPKLVNKR